MLYSRSLLFFYFMYASVLLLIPRSLFYNPFFPFSGLPWWLRWQRICLQNGRPGFHPWVGKIPWRREQLPTPAFLPGEFHGQKCLVSYSPWGCRELDTTEQLSLTHIAFIHVPGVVLHRLNVLIHLIISTTPLQGSYYSILLSLCCVLSRI